jgi:hypothetical protein
MVDGEIDDAPLNGGSFVSWAWDHESARRSVCRADARRT